MCFKNTHECSTANVVYCKEARIIIENRALLLTYFMKKVAFVHAAGRQIPGRDSLWIIDWDQRRSCGVCLPIRVCENVLRQPPACVCAQGSVLQMAHQCWFFHQGLCALSRDFTLGSIWKNKEINSTMMIDFVRIQLLLQLLWRCFLLLCSGVHYTGEMACHVLLIV